MKEFKRYLSKINEFDLMLKNIIDIFFKIRKQKKIKFLPKKTKKNKLFLANCDFCNEINQIQKLCTKHNLDRKPRNFGRNDKLV